ncbi:hypothetical protein ACJZ2D_016332 [Fusarium nematophilum]
MLPPSIQLASPRPPHSRGSFGTAVKLLKVRPSASSSDTNHRHNRLDRPSMTPRPRPTKRAANACEACHARKTRCSIPQTGVPCTNCALDSVHCQLRQRRTAKARQQPNRPTLQVPTEPDVTSEDACAVETIDAPYAPLAAHLSHHRNTDTAANSSSGGGPITYSPLYGDPRSIGLVADICQPERQGKSGHFLVASLATPELDLETTEFLKSRGVFDLPCFDVSKSLVQLYFHYVHPFFPVLDVPSFLGAFENNGAEKLSLHLLWSVFLAAANALYDAEYERDKTTLIQAVLLMGFWYADTEDRIGPWHWNGVAIGLCTSIGLHRQPDTSLGRQSSSSSTINEALWQQLWWVCFFRETWLSAGMGRPSRLDLAYSNTLKPDAQGFDEAWEKLSSSVRQTYLPSQMKTLVPLWRDLLDITTLQSEVLSVQHKVPPVRQSTPEVERIETKLRSFERKLSEMEDCSTDNILLLHVYHAELFLDSTFLTLYRPFMLKDLGISSPLDGENSGGVFNATKKSRAAAQHTNNVLGNLIGSDMIKVSQALICIAIVPALQTHLLHASSPEKIARRLGSHYLALCMIAVEELRKTYFGAEILFKLFTRAQEKLDNRHSLLAPPCRSGSEIENQQQATHAGPTEPSSSGITWNLGDSRTNTPNSSLTEELDVEWILSQCMFPDFASIAVWDQQQSTPGQHSS